MRNLLSLTMLIATVSVLVADQPKYFEPSTIKEKVRVKPNDDFVVEFNLNGNQLTNPSKSKQAEIKKISIKVKLDQTDASPMPPPREGAMRPYLSIENNFEKTLHFRALVRIKGSKEFVELTEDINPIPAGETFNKCWGFDTQVEEVILFDFTLSDKPVK